MEHSTEFPGPGADDYENVLALNRVFLDLSTNHKGPQKGRLAVAPFLLFSLRENELPWWEGVLSVGRQGDLLQPPNLASDDVRALQAASLGFLWQLARRNAYAARIITGAGPGWCEMLIEQPLITLLERVGTRADLMRSRLDAPHGADARFLTGGASSRTKLRHSSHIVALQSMLTSNREEPSIPASAAACNLSIPSASVAAGNLRRVSDRKV